jgi:hypothetical protein
MDRKRQIANRSKINVDDAHELKYGCGHLAYPKEQLVKAVEKVGNTLPRQEKSSPTWTNNANRPEKLRMQRQASGAAEDGAR